MPCNQLSLACGIASSNTPTIQQFYTHLGVRKPGDASRVQDGPPLDRRSRDRAREATYRLSDLAGRMGRASAFSKLAKIPGQQMNK